jgi:hypothetical protein
MVKTASLSSVTPLCVVEVIRTRQSVEGSSGTTHGWLRSFGVEAMMVVQAPPLFVLYSSMTLAPGLPVLSQVMVSVVPCSKTSPPLG